MPRIRAPQDFWSGVLFIAFATVAIVVSRNYSLGTTARMGPGYFPLLLGVALGLIGVALIGRSLLIEGPRVGVIAARPLVAIALAVVLFGLLLPHVGLVAALLIVVGVAAFASRESKPVESVSLAIAIAIFSIAVFVYGLKLPLPVWPQG
ncbi:MAG: tripartite tricarboxylate transporter TctB family protein [Hyphomicrobiales bacterium]|nr:tripartite tricarboxylate transporter TctB family protein [Hyphomicrobiales bacterium]